MKILMLTGSPRRRGATNLMADAFRKGAEENGHTVVRFDCARMDVHPCTGCFSCRKDGPCVLRDDMVSVEREIPNTDVLVYVTPVYYAGMSAQIKTVIDRFYSFNTTFKRVHPKMALITSAHERVSSSTDVVIRQYREILKYIGSEDLGTVNALGIQDPEDLEGTDFVQKAYELGRSI